MTAPAAHSLSITDLLLRDPQHPEVRRLLLYRYEQVCHEARALASEKAMLETVLDLKRAKAGRIDTLDSEQRNRVG
jgi:hypothetical protein